MDAATVMWPVGLHMTQCIFLFGFNFTVTYKLKTFCIQYDLKVATEAILSSGNRFFTEVIDQRSETCGCFAHVQCLPLGLIKN